MGMCIFATQELFCHLFVHYLIWKLNDCCKRKHSPEVNVTGSECWLLPAISSCLIRHILMFSGAHGHTLSKHYSDVIMGAMVSQITSLAIVYSAVYSGVDQRKHQSSASLAFVRGIHRWPVNSPHKWPVTRKLFPFDDVIMNMKAS